MAANKHKDNTNAGFEQLNFKLDVVIELLRSMASGIEGRWLEFANLLIQLMSFVQNLQPYLGRPFS